MSVWLLDGEHIAAMLETAFDLLNGAGSDGALRAGHRKWHRDTPEEDPGFYQLADMLARENWKSYRERYAHRDDLPEHPVTVTNTSRRLTPVELLKACRCYIYQACESPTWDSSTARHIVEQEIQLLAIANLPGYGEAPWGIDA